MVLGGYVLQLLLVCTFGLQYTCGQLQPCISEAFYSVVNLLQLYCYSVIRIFYWWRGIWLVYIIIILTVQASSRGHSDNRYVWTDSACLQEVFSIRVPTLFFIHAWHCTIAIWSLFSPTDSICGQITNNQYFSSSDEIILLLQSCIIMMLQAHVMPCMTCIIQYNYLLIMHTCSGCLS